MTMTHFQAYVPPRAKTKRRRRPLYQNERSVPSRNPKWRADVQREKLGTTDLLSAAPARNVEKIWAQKRRGDKSLDRGDTVGIAREMLKKSIWKRWYKIFITRSRNLGLLFVYNGNLWK